MQNAIKPLMNISLIILFICTVLLFVSEDSRAAILDSGECGDNLAWTLSTEGDLTITGTGDMSNDVPWGSYATEVTSISIDERVTSICDNAFKNCSGVSSITIPSNVRYIGSNAFASCQGLTEIVIPNSVESIGAGALKSCTNLTSISLPFVGSSREAAGTGDAVLGYVFGVGIGYACNQYYSNNNYEQYFLPQTLVKVSITDATIIPYGAFCGCLKLKEIVLSDSIQIIDENAMNGCAALETITVPFIGRSRGSNDTSTSSRFIHLFGSNVSNAGSFWEYSPASDGPKYYIPISLKSVAVTDATQIPTYAFLDMKLLTTITINEGVKTINKKAFNRCLALTGFTIPGSVETIGENAFMHCESLVEIVIPNSVKTINASAFQSCSSLNNVSIGSKVTALPEYVFSYCTSLRKIIIPGTVNSIGTYAFKGCSVLTTISIGNGVKSIGEEAFIDCPGPSTLIIPNSITTIGRQAFSGFSNLTSISIPFIGSKRTDTDSSTAKLRYIFGAVAPSSLSSVTITDAIQIPDRAFESSSLSQININYGVESIGGYAFSSQEISEITIPESVTTIGGGAFRYCLNLTEVTIPDSVQSMGQAVFQGCSGLTSISLPFVGSSRSANGTNDALFGYVFSSTIPEIPATSEYVSATQYYSSNSSIQYYFPRSLTTVSITDQEVIPYGAFRGCGFLTEISLAVASEISNTAFYDCSGLETIKVDSSLSRIGNNAFYRDSALTDVYAGSLESWCQIEFATVYANPLSYAQNLYLDGELLNNELIIPEGIDTVNDYAFYNCDSIASVIIPVSVSSIGESAFENCDLLSSVTLPDSVAFISDTAFGECANLELSNITQIVLSDNALSLNYGDERLLAYELLPSGSYAGRNIEWESSDETVVKVLGNGLIMAMGAGQALVTVKNGAIRSECEVTVNKVVPKYTVPDNITAKCEQTLRSISLPNGFSWDNLDESVGGVGEKTFNATYTPSDTNNYETVTNIGIRITVAHDYSASFSYDEEKHWHECACGERINVVNHNFGEWNITKKATCITTGSKEKVCENCRYIVVETIPANGHNWNNQYTVDTPASCTAEGSESIHCSICDEKQEGSSRTIAKKSHNYGDWVVTEEATCTEDGSKEKECAACGHKVTDAIPSTGHSFDKDFTVDLEPSCTEKGSKSRHCANCDMVTEVTDIPANGHTFGKWTKVTPSTCEDSGLEQRKCKICGFMESRDLDPNGHEWEEDYTVDVEPTCTEDGSRSIHCMNCNATINSEVIPAPGHQYGKWTITVDPTCTEAGSRERVCEVCKDKATESISAKGHSWNSEATVDKEPTCTKAGSQSIHCARCDATKGKKTIPALGHNWQAPTYKWSSDNSKVTATHICDNDTSHKQTESVTTTSKVTKEPTCTAVGKRKYTSATFTNTAFKVQTKTVDIAKIDHSWDSGKVTKEATCVSKGSKIYTCTSCNKTKTETIPIDADAHSWTAPTYKWSSDNSQVTATRVCENKSSHKQTETAKATETITKEPTCTASGKKKYTSAAFTNGAFKVQTKTVTINALGHKWKHIKIPAELLKDGSEYDQCTVCNVIQNRTVINGYATSYVKSFKVSKGKKAFTAKWKKQSKANQKKFDGYQIMYSTESDMSGAKYATAKKSSKSKKIGKLQKKTKYYVQVRTYTKSSGKTYYSDWSTKKSITTK